MKQAMTYSTREVLGSAMVEGKCPMNLWWNNVVKPLAEREESAWKEVMGGRDEVAKDRYRNIYKEEKRKVKKCMYHSKK